MLTTLTDSFIHSFVLFE